MKKYYCYQSEISIKNLKFNILLAKLIKCSELMD